MMKKRLAIIMAAAMITGVSASTAFAEGPSMEGAPQMGGPQAPGGNAPQGEAPSDSGQQAPEMNNNQPPQGEAPSDSGQQAPQMDNNQGQQIEAPTDNNQQKFQNGMSERKGGGQVQSKDRRGPEEDFGFVPFEDYVKDGTISQETYDAITKYMDENKPELPEGIEKGERTEGSGKGEKPEIPEGTAEGDKPEMKEGEGPDLLKDLLSAGVITQEEYDALAAKREASRPAAQSGSQEEDASGTTETNKDA